MFSPKHNSRFCNIPGCNRPTKTYQQTRKKNGDLTSMHYKAVCDAHAMRKRRYGSYTSAMCRRCKRCFDDVSQETHILNENHTQWICRTCLLGVNDAAIGVRAIKKFAQGFGKGANKRLRNMLKKSKLSSVHAKIVGDRIISHGITFEETSEDR